MTTRRDTVAAGSAAAILASIGIFPAFAALEHEAARIDRELRLSISDGFTRQVWLHAGEQWTETRDVLSFRDEELVRITITNDRPGARVISFGAGRELMRLRPGETRSIVLDIGRPGTFDISVIDQPMITRPAKVRANADAFANVI
jgi:hypothetical protein